MVPCKVLFSMLVALAIFDLSSGLASSCYSCSDGECINSATIGFQKDCDTAAGDSCYTIFEGLVPIKRGCRLELEAAQQALCPGDNCEVCDTDNCNSHSKATHQCLVCSSTAEERCVSDPASLDNSQCGAPTLDVTDHQCYSRVVGGVTERGCIQSQTDVDGCVGSHCKTCVGTGCNKAEFPENRQKCVKCDSQACNLQSVTSYCDYPDDNCVTARRQDGSYLKTCERSMSESDVQLCSSKQSTCSYCGKHECNKVELDAEASRQCYTCSGTDCLRTALLIETCHNSDDECFSEFDGFNPSRRGCKSVLSEQEKTICDDAGDVNCEMCATDICNLESREDHQCMYCSSAVDANCIAVPNRQIQCPSPTTEISDEAQCYTRVIGKVTERGCLGTAVDYLGCKSSETCQTCKIQNANGCNTALFPANRRKCMVGTQLDQYCGNPSDRCVQTYQNNVNTMTCESSMSELDVSFCNQNSNKCYFCSADNCNQGRIAFDYLECLSCDSASDPNCATLPSAISSTSMCTTCATVLTARTGGRSTVYRNCLESLPAAQATQCLNSQNCSRCNSNRCNREMYPSDRLSCYSCPSGACFSHADIKLEYCPNYQSADNCFALLDTEGKPIHMGCKSSLNATEASGCALNPMLCKTCNSTACNEPTKYVSSGRCVQCNSSLDLGCVGRADGMESEPCNDPLNRMCYTRIVSGLTVRGCVNDLDAESKTRCNQGQDCSLCISTSEKCNTNVYPANRLACYTCLTPPCISHETTTLQYCPLYQSGEKCMALMDSTGRPVRFSCNSTLSATEHNTCATNPSLCRSCSTSQCNNPSTFLGSASCIQCSSSIDGDCLNGASKYDPEPCNNPENTRCYSRLTSDGHTERGCVNDLDESSRTKCLAGSDCSVCSATGGKCNYHEYPMGQIKCYQCNSTTDVTCKNIQYGGGSYCPSYNGAHKCYAIQYQDGSVVRMCSTAQRQEECSGTVRCEMCLFSGCNDRVTSELMLTNATSATTTVLPPTRQPSSAAAALVANLAALALAMVTLNAGIRSLFKIL